MRTRDRQALNDMTGEHLIAMLDRMAGFAKKVEGGPWIPWLRPGVSHAAARRTAARLRSGALNLNDPRLPAPMLADMIDRSVEKDLVVRETVNDIRKGRAMKRFFEEQYADEQRRSTVAGFHEMKKAAAADPEGPAAEEARRMSRELRKERGRP